MTDRSWVIWAFLAVGTVVLAIWLTGCSSAPRLLSQVPTPPLATSDDVEGPSIKFIESELGIARARVAALESQLEARQEAEAREDQRRLVVAAWWVAGLGILALIAGGVLMALGLSKRLAWGLISGGGIVAILAITCAWAVPFIFSYAPLIAFVVVASVLFVTWRQRQIEKAAFQTGVKAMDELKTVAPANFEKIRSWADRQHQLRGLDFRNRVHQEVQRHQRIVRGVEHGNP